MSWANRAIRKKPSLLGSRTSRMMTSGKTSQKETRKSDAATKLRLATINEVLVGLGVKW